MCANGQYAPNMGCTWLSHPAMPGMNTSGQGALQIVSKWFAPAPILGMRTHGHWTSWSNELLSEFTEDYFSNLLKFLVEESSRRKIIYPPANQVFSFTHHCDISSVRVVILGQDPYLKPHQADGLAFSFPHSMPIPGRLSQEISHDVPIPGCLTNIYNELQNETNVAFPKNDWFGLGTYTVQCAPSNNSHTRGILNICEGPLTTSEIGNLCVEQGLYTIQSDNRVDPSLQNDYERELSDALHSGRKFFKNSRMVKFYEPSIGIIDHGSVEWAIQDGLHHPRSFKNIYEGQLAVNFEHPGHGNLEGWAKQGVLLLNSVLTVEKGKANFHKRRGWEQFTDAIVSWINSNCHGVVFLLWGECAQEKAETIDKKKHYILRASHPSSRSAHLGFNGCNHFFLCNALLKAQGKDPIDWNLPT